MRREVPIPAADRAGRGREKCAGRFPFRRRTGRGGGGRNAPGGSHSGGGPGAERP
jgi:hypothetical protein